MYEHQWNRSHLFFVCKKCPCFGEKRGTVSVNVTFTNFSNEIKCGINYKCCQKKMNNSNWYYLLGGRGGGGLKNLFCCVLRPKVLNPCFHFWRKTSFIGWPVYLYWSITFVNNSVVLSYTVICKRIILLRVERSAIAQVLRKFLSYRALKYAITRNVLAGFWRYF